MVIAFILSIILLVVMFGWRRYRQSLQHDRQRLSVWIVRAVERQTSGKARIIPKIRGKHLEILIGSQKDSIEDLAARVQDHPNLLRTCRKAFDTVSLTDGTRAVELSPRR